MLSTIFKCQPCHSRDQRLDRLINKRFLNALPPPCPDLQQMADENQMRIELQMALDSKDSDIEQLRNTLQTLSVQSMDTASVCSGPEMDTDDAYTGTRGPPQWGPECVLYLNEQSVHIVVT